jgi:hypothetical protein
LDGAGLFSCARNAGADGLFFSFFKFHADSQAIADLHLKTGDEGPALVNYPKGYKAGPLFETAQLATKGLQMRLRAVDD